MRDGVWFISQESGVSIEDLGVLPGEITRIPFSFDDNPWLDPAGLFDVSNLGVRERHVFGDNVVPFLKGQKLRCSGDVLISNDMWAAAKAEKEASA